MTSPSLSHVRFTLEPVGKWYRGSPVSSPVQYDRGSTVHNRNMFGAPPLMYRHSRQWHCALSCGLPAAA